MPDPIKSGHLKFFSRILFSKKWKEGWFVLYSDSMLRRYDNPIDTKPSDSIYLRDVCQFLAVGEYTRPIVNRPPLPSSLDERLLVAIPRNKRKNVKNILWILFHSIDEMNDWMRAISNTLPPPPAPIRPLPPPRPPVPFNGNGTGSYNNGSSIGNFRPTKTIIQLPPAVNYDYEIHYQNVSDDSYSYRTNNEWGCGHHDWANDISNIDPVSIE